MISIARKFVNAKLSDEAFAVVCYLRGCVTGSREYILLSEDIVEYVLYETKTRTRSHTTTVHNVLRELEDFGIIYPDGHIYIAERADFNSEKQYILMEDNVLDDFIHSDRTNKWGLFHLYAMILGGLSSWYKFKGGNHPVNYFAELLGVSDQTVSRYMKALEEMKLICLFSLGYNEKEPKTNVYGRYADRNELQELIQVMGEFVTEKEQTNFKRSVRVRYGKYMENPYSYTQEEREALKKDVNRYNDIQRPFCGSHSWAVLLDTSVFNLT